MSKILMKKKIQKWDEVTGTEVEESRAVESPEDQAEGQAIVNPLDDNPLKNAEMAMEDDYDSIDGVINNGSKNEKDADLKEEQQSVIEKIHEHEEKIKQQNQLHQPEKKKKISFSQDKGF